MEVQQPKSTVKPVTIKEACAPYPLWAGVLQRAEAKGRQPVPLMLGP